MTGDAIDWLLRGDLGHPGYAIRGATYQPYDNHELQQIRKSGRHMVMGRWVATLLECGEPLEGEIAAWAESAEAHDRWLQENRPA